MRRHEQHAVSPSFEAASEASRLADALRNGGRLEPRTIEGVPLEAGEVAYADLSAVGWRYFGLDAVSYERRTVLFGGPYVMAIAALASAIGNGRRRRDAEQLAAPQWRPLGMLRIVATSARLLVWHERAWWSVWYAGINDLRIDRSQTVLDLFFDADPPYRLAGPGMPVLGVALWNELFDTSAEVQGADETGRRSPTLSGASYSRGILSHRLGTLAGVGSDVPDLSLDELARLHLLRGAQLMWLLGAGASAAAGIPTAGQMIDEFRTLIYSTVHGVPLAALNLAEPAVRERVERFFAEHPDYPSPGDPGEYSALFEEAWPAAPDRRAYVDSKVAAGRPAFGNFGLAVLLALDRARLVWTTNFDRVAERAAELVLEPPAHLTVAALETGDIAVQALAQDRFPLYVKLHGDFQSERLKNTAAELRQQDDRHRAAFVQAAQRYGLIVSGYSGRDDSLMAALRDALDGGDTPFPAGLLWCRRPAEDPAPQVEELLMVARERRVDARWVLVHTFDELIGQLLLTATVPPRLQQILDQARPPRRREPFTIPARHGQWPILRLNAVQLAEFPPMCRQVECGIEGTAAVRGALAAVGARAVAARRSGGVIAFGYDSDIRAALDPFGIRSWSLGSIVTNRLRRDGSSDLGLLYDALTGALARERPLVARRTGGAHFLAVDPDRARDPTFTPLRRVLGELARQRPAIPGGGEITGRIGRDGPPWIEAVRVRLGYHFDALWLVFESVVWIEKSDGLDHDMRTTFVGPRTWHRYNPVANVLFDAWSRILYGSDGRCALFGIDEQVGVDAVFRLDVRTGFSRERGR
jgi:hypothetical protein